MKIIVVGDGKVGFAIAKQLNQEGHDITVVENKANVSTRYCWCAREWG